MYPFSIKAKSIPKTYRKKKQNKSHFTLKINLNLRPLCLMYLMYYLMKKQFNIILHLVGAIGYVMSTTCKRPLKVAIAIEVVTWHVGPPCGYSLSYEILRK